MSESFQGTEKLKLRANYLRDIGMIGLSSLAIYNLEDQLGLLDQSFLPWSVAAALFYIAGRVADKVSTIKVLDVVKESEELDIPRDVIETNPYLPDRPSKKDLFHPKKISLEMAYLVPAVVFPPVGVFLGLASFYASVHNTRLYRKIKNDIKPEYIKI
jgi:hypothetical protein